MRWKVIWGLLSAYGAGSSSIIPSVASDVRQSRGVARRQFGISTPTLATIRGEPDVALGGMWQCGIFGAIEGLRRQAGCHVGRDVGKIRWAMTQDRRLTITRETCFLPVDGAGNQIGLLFPCLSVHRSIVLLSHLILLGCFFNAARTYRGKAGPTHRPPQHIDRPMSGA
jgi:hypothetical protein